MKFLSEFISCYGGGQQQPPAFEHAADITTTHRVVPASRTSDAKKKKKKKKLQSSSGNWKPVLSVIVENSVVLFDANINHKRKSSVSKSTATFPSYSGDDFRKSFHPMDLPAFSPTPFLF